MVRSQLSRPLAPCHVVHTVVRNASKDTQQFRIMPGCESGISSVVCFLHNVLAFLRYIEMSGEAFRLTAQIGGFV